jgi:hypothetical protein
MTDTTTYRGYWSQLNTKILVILVLLAIPAELFAKAETSKVIIKGAGLSAPFEITDTNTLANFHVWTGAGTSCTPIPACSTASTQSFIVDWSCPIADHPNGLHCYEVSVHAKMPGWATHLRCVL